MNNFDHSTFISPFTWRYASTKMREIFSEKEKRKLQRLIWIALAKAQNRAGIVTDEQIEELVKNKDNIDIERSSEIENEIHHDLMAEIKTYSEQCPKAGSIIHLGATSMDIQDNMEAIRTKKALSLIINKTKTLLSVFIGIMDKYKALPCMAFTHIQPAEITTVGYRMSQTAQDLITDIKNLSYIYDNLKGKGIKGAVGTGASYKELLKDTDISSIEMERLVMKELDLKPFIAATQIYTRKQDLEVIASLSSLAATLSRFCLDFRILQSPPIGEWAESFSINQVGSSAMPFKRNPINCEKVDSIARFISSQYTIAWQNASSMILERTLDDSANRRLMIPESFLAMDEILETIIKIVKGMTINEVAIKKNMNSYGLFSATERLLMEAGRRGANRQEMHETIRNDSLKAWQEVQNGNPNPLLELILSNKEIQKYLTSDEIKMLLNAENYTGDAEYRTQMIIEKAKEVL